MANGAFTQTRLARFSSRGAERAKVLIGVAAVLGLGGALVPYELAQLGLFAAGSALFLFGIFMTVIARKVRQAYDMTTGAIAEVIEKDKSPSFVCSENGEVLRANAAARAAYSVTQGEGLAIILRNIFANPNDILLHLKAQVDAEEAAYETIVTRNGHLRLSVHKTVLDHLLWRLEAMPDPRKGRSADGHELPMMIIERDGSIVDMTDAACALIGQRVNALDEVFVSLPVTSGTLTQVLGIDGPIDIYLNEVDAGAGRTALYLLPPPLSEVSSWSSFEELPVPLVRFSADGRVRGYNQTGKRLIGDVLAEGVHLSDLMEGLGRPITDWLDETISGRSVQQSEFLRLKRPDKEMFVQVALNRMREEGEASIIAVLADATELKTLEAQFVQSQKMQAIGQLAGGVAHDFNNLLTAISGHCDLLLLRHNEADVDYSDLMQINQNANRAAALVGQLLAFSRKQTLRPEDLDLRETMSDLTHLLNRLVGEKVRLTLSHDPVLKTIRADKRQLEQVLMNLVVNARDAMPDGGEIQIETEHLNLVKPLERDRVSVPVGQYVCLRVVDKGVGIPSDKLQKIFEPFYTTKRTGEGTGLGLSTAYGIVKQTGGFIFVDSVVGEGTRFSIMFPAVERVEHKAVETVKPAQIPEPKHGEGVILLVEDEAPVRAFASRALRLRGYTVLEADSAEAALKTLEDRSLNVDLFVTDVVMPGKDGPSWVREALIERPEVRVVFVSGYTEDKLDDQNEKIPNSVFLPKPFSLNDLAETVYRQLH